MDQPVAAWHGGPGGPGPPPAKKKFGKKGAPKIPSKPKFIQNTT